MKKTTTLLFLISVVSINLYCQDVLTTGKPIAEIFTDFHYNLNDTSQTNGFAINRAYLGYNYTPVGSFSATIILNVGNPDDLAPDAKPRRYVYVREASLKYTKGNLDIFMGMTGTRSFDYQQKFWGKRYIANTFQSINGYGLLADIGVVVDYKFNEIFKGDFSLMNGEGYYEVQLDNSVKSAAGLTITPNKKLSFRIYGDITRPSGVTQYTLIGFAGFKNSLISIGGEINYKSNLDFIEGHNAWGISATGGINITEKNEVFVRYDHSTSVIPSGETMKWNSAKDGNFIITGIQHTISPVAKLALNYQGTFQYSDSKNNNGIILLNALFKF